jgi:hypothetical protein
MSASSFFGIGKEATRGTGTTATTFIPIEQPVWTPNVKWLEDKGWRGSPATVYSHQAGVRNDSYDFKGAAFLDTLPNFLMAMLGGTDVVTGSGPYVHTFGMLDSIAVGSQPPSYTLNDFDAGMAGTTTARRLVDGQMDTLSLSFAVDAELSVSGKFITNALTTVTAPTDLWSSEVFVPAWNCAVSFGGSPSSVVIDGSIDLKRSTEPIFTLGQQSSYRNWAGPLEASGKCSAVYENTADPLAGATIITAGTTRVITPVTFTFTEPVSGHTCLLQMSQCQLMNPKITRDATYGKIEFDFSAEANTTDTTVTHHFAPITTVITNGQAAIY